jgi:hypothetical protein
MIDITIDIVKWLREVNIAEKDINKKAEKIFAKTVDLVLTNTINWTPIGKPELWKYPAGPDYEPGTLKGSWRANWSGPREVTIENKVPYAMRVEYGWSSQAPNGMFRRALALYPKFIEKMASEVDRQYSGNTELFNSGLYDRF